MTGGIVGAGYFANHHAEAWRRIPGVSIRAVADPARDRREAFAAQWGIPAQYDGAEEMLDREGLDFADIATRPESHLALTTLAARRGVNVICQKPMAPSLGECIAMVELCREARVRLIVHENWRWQPWYREIRRLIEAGAVGRVCGVSFRMRAGDGRGPAPYAVQPYFREMPRLLIHETLVHFLDTFRYLAGEIEAVFCTVQRLNPVIAGEDGALIQVRFASGASGLIDANRLSGDVPPPVAFGELSLEGDTGAMNMTPAGDLRLVRYGETWEQHEYPKPAEGYKGDSVKAFQHHAVSCLLSGEGAESEGGDYLKTVAAVEACYRSSESGRLESACL